MKRYPTRILSFNRHTWTKSVLIGCLWFLAATVIHSAEPVASLSSADLDRLVGQPADIAPSAYQYRADRKPQDNPPESWLAIMRFAGQPLNKPADTNAPAVKQVLTALLWEEIRPVMRLELVWPSDAKHRPAPVDLAITTLDNQSSASSWWNNLKAVQKSVNPTVSEDGKMYVDGMGTPTCGIVISVAGTKPAADYDVPQVRVLVGDVWKKMDVEIEWGFDKANADKDYSGRIETYDGVVAGLCPPVGDVATKVTAANSWLSVGGNAGQRGLKFSLLYMGTSKWRKTIPFTSQRDDVARTIVTVWTKSGNFSFLAADLENGPILAPEYGFFVRRVPEQTASSQTASSAKPASGLFVPRILLSTKMLSIAGSTDRRFRIRGRAERGLLSDGGEPIQRQTGASVR